VRTLLKVYEAEATPTPAPDSLVVLQDELEAIAASWVGVGVATQVAELNSAVWSESLISEVLCGLRGEAVQMRLRDGLSLAGLLEYVWHEFLLLRADCYQLVPLHALESLRVSQARLRLGAPTKGVTFATALRRLVAWAHPEPVLVWVFGQDQETLKVARQLQRVGQDWVGVSSRPEPGNTRRAYTSSRSPGLLEICPIKNICCVQFSALITPRQVFFDLNRLDTPLASSTNF